jgi:hypothetical protein
MDGFVRFLWATCLSMPVLLGASTAGAGEDGFTEIRICVRDPRLKPSVREWVYSVSSADILTTADEAPVLPVVPRTRKPGPMTALCGDCRSNKTVDEIGQQMALAAAMLTLQMSSNSRTHAWAG